MGLDEGRKPLTTKGKMFTLTVFADNDDAGDNNIASMTVIHAHSDSSFCCYFATGTATSASKDNHCHSDNYDHSQYNK